MLVVRSVYTHGWVAERLVELLRRDSTRVLKPIIFYTRSSASEVVALSASLGEERLELNAGRPDFAKQLMRFDREDYALRPGSDVGVFMCGPDTVASSLRTGAQHAMLTSFMNAPANGEDQMTSFFFTKEHF